MLLAVEIAYAIATNKSQFCQKKYIILLHKIIIRSVIQKSFSKKNKNTKDRRGGVEGERSPRIGNRGSIAGRDRPKS